MAQQEKVRRRRRRKNRKASSKGFTPRFIQEITQHSRKDIMVLMRALGR